MRQLWPTRPKPTRPFDFVIAAFMVAATSILPGVVVFALASAAVAAVVAWTLEEGGGRSLQHHSIAQRELGLINCANTQVSLV
jgi:hypothetical protein